MSIRKPTLEEWWLIYQLRNIKKHHFHLPFYMEVDITPLAKQFEEKGERVPTTAILIKAASFLVKKHPKVNRMVMHTFRGVKIVQPEYNHVNLPIILDVEEERYLSALTIKEPHSKSLSDIKGEIKEALKVHPLDRPIGKILFKKKNNCFNRFRLKVVHFFAYHFPSLMIKHGAGAIAVSSLGGLDNPDWNMHMMAYGPTAFTIGSCQLKKKDNKSILHLGIAYDHYAFSGEEGVLFSRSLDEILRTETF